jgi:hypothetical protein
MAGRASVQNAGAAKAMDGRRDRSSGSISHSYFFTISVIHARQRAHSALPSLVSSQRCHRARRLVSVYATPRGEYRSELCRAIGCSQRELVKVIADVAQRSSVFASAGVSGMQHAFRFFRVFFGVLALHPLHSVGGQRHAEP